MAHSGIVREMMLRYDENTAATPEELCRPYAGRPEHRELVEAVREAIADVWMGKSCVLVVSALAV
jgi:hypothetical protein